MLSVLCATAAFPTTVNDFQDYLMHCKSYVMQFLTAATRLAAGARSFCHNKVSCWHRYNMSN